MTDNTADDGIDFDTLADAADLALSGYEHEWLNGMSNTPGRGIRREYHFCGQKLLGFDIFGEKVITGSFSVRSDLSAWDDGLGSQIVPSPFVMSLTLKNHKYFSVNILDSITLYDSNVVSVEVSVSARINDGFSFYLWAGYPEHRFLSQ